MHFLSLFSGIEAASAAWAPLGWTCVGVSEIEPYPCALLAHRHPTVPNLGDITKITEEQVAALGHIDVIVFGSPCQDLSVAGKRKGFTDADGDFTRSGLFFAAMRVIGWARVHCGLRFALWENVPGAFSSNAGADFGAVVGQLAGMEAVVPPKGWGTEGAAVGTEAMVEWSVLDAQFFGVAQRRRRVFALADFGDWAGRPPILLEPYRMRGDSTPRREAGQDATAGTLRRTDGGCDVDHVRAHHCVAVAPTLRAGGNSTGGDRPPGTDVDTCDSLIPIGGLPRPVLAYGGNNTAGPIDVATACNACNACSNLAKTVNNQTPLLAFEVAAPVTRSVERPRGDGLDTLIAFDSRQDCVSSTEVFGALGSSSPQAQAVCFAENSRGEVRLEGGDGLCAGALSTGGGKPGQGYPAIAFMTRGSNLDVGEISGTIGTNCDRATGSAPMVAHAITSFASREVAGCITSNYGKQLDNSDTALGPNVAITAMQVRRLTPRECERLQGFPDDHTLVPFRGKPAADGPRYKGIGNSMAVPVMAYIGRQIDFAMLFDTAPAPADDCGDLFV